MAAPILVPRLGWTMEEGVFEGWLKQEGEQVRAGEPLFALEGEKASQDVEAVDSGLLRIPPGAPKKGDIVPVGAVLGYLLDADEPLPWECSAAARQSAGSGPDGPSAAPTFAAVPSNDAPGTGARDQGTDRATTPRISPRARRVARELGVDWRALRGTGKGGRIRERDVRAALHAEGAQPAPVLAGRPPEGTQAAAAPGAESAIALPPGSRVPMTPMRKTIAQRLRASLQTTAPVTLTTEADATNLVNLRRQFRATAAAQATAAPAAGAQTASQGGEVAAVSEQQTGPTAADSFGLLVPTYTDLIVKLTAAALDAHRLMTAQWTDDGLVVPDGIHIGIAVDTDAGLLVPVLRNVPALTLQQLAAAMRSLVEAARARRLTAEQLAGGTFTITNLGAYGIDAFTPIIQTPQSAILGVGRIRRVAAVLGDQVVPRDHLTLSLTFDHRVVDGAPAARFLDTLRQSIENPAPWLVP